MSLRSGEDHEPQPQLQWLEDGIDALLAESTRILRLCGLCLVQLVTGLLGR